MRGWFGALFFYVFLFDRGWGGISRGICSALEGSKAIWAMPISNKYISKRGFPIGILHDLERKLAWLSFVTVLVFVFVFVDIFGWSSHKHAICQEHQKQCSCKKIQSSGKISEYILHWAVNLSLKQDCEASCPTFHGRNFTIDTKDVKEIEGVFEVAFC